MKPEKVAEEEEECSRTMGRGVNIIRRRRIFTSRPGPIVRRTEALPITSSLYETGVVTTARGSSHGVYATSSREVNLSHASSAKKEEDTAEYVGTAGNRIPPTTACEGDNFTTKRMDNFLFSDTQVFSGRDWGEFRWLLHTEGEEDASSSSQPSFGTLRQPSPFLQAPPPSCSSTQTTREIPLTANSSSLSLPRLQQSSPILPSSQRVTSPASLFSNFIRPSPPRRVPLMKHARSATKTSASFTIAKSVLPSVSQSLPTSPKHLHLTSQLHSASKIPSTSNSALQSFSQSTQRPSPAPSGQHPATSVSLPSSPKPLTPLSPSHSSQMHPVPPNLTPPPLFSPNLQLSSSALSPSLQSRAPSLQLIINYMFRDNLGIMATISEYIDPKLEEDLRSKDSLFGPIDWYDSPV